MRFVPGDTGLVDRRLAGGIAGWVEHQGIVLAVGRIVLAVDHMVLLDHAEIRRGLVCRTAGCNPVVAARHSSPALDSEGGKKVAGSLGHSLVAAVGMGSAIAGDIA